jgi:tetratricopeptide (TPR) repeat protein
MNLGMPAIVVGAALLLPRPAVEARQAGLAQEPPAIRELNAAFAASYSLDHDQAIAHARRAVQLDPENSRVQRGLASILWLDLLFYRGAMTVDTYLGTLQSMQLALPKPDPELAAEFKGAIGRAIELAERRLKQRPNDLDALYDAGAAYGIQATYLASVEGGITSAFRSARRAFDMQRQVLARDPSRAPAGLIVGTYRYVVATQPMLVRFFAYLAGFGGDKEKALAMLEAASHDPLTRVDAKAALILIYSREGRLAGHAPGRRTGGRAAAQSSLPARAGRRRDSGGARRRSRHDPHARAGRVREGPAPEDPGRARIVAVQARAGPAEPESS